MTETVYSRGFSQGNCLAIPSWKPGSRWRPTTHPPAGTASCSGHREGRLHDLRPFLRQGFDREKGRTPAALVAVFDVLEIAPDGRGNRLSYAFAIVLSENEPSPAHCLVPGTIGDGSSNRWFCGTVLKCDRPFLFRLARTDTHGLATHDEHGRGIVDGHDRAETRPRHHRPRHHRD